MHRVWIVSLACISASSLGPVKYFETTEMTKEIFEALMMNGEVAVIRKASSFWPIADWKCDQFRTNPDMRGFHVERVYGANDGSFVPLCSTCEEWDKDERPSYNDDVEGPSLAPLYWDVKGNEASKDVIDSLTPPWHFLSKPNYYWKKNAVELWFSPSKAGAKYHIDGHVQMTAVSQLTGKRRWRLALVPEVDEIGLIPNHLDSNSFEWTPEINVTLEKGDVLLFPPGSIHDTLNLDESECAVSVTHQLGVPYPVKFYRTHLRRLARISDMRETWPIIADLATFGFLRPRLTTTAPFFEVHANVDNLFPDVFKFNEANASLFFIHVYEQFLGRPDQHPLVGTFGNRKLSEYIAYNDTDEDGQVSLSEFIENSSEWLIIESGIMESLPQKFRPMRYFYETIESKVSPEYMAEVSTWSSPPRHDEL